MSGSVVENFMSAVIDSMKHVYFFVNEYGDVMWGTVSSARADSEERMKLHYPKFDSDTSPFGCTLVKLDKSALVWPLDKAEYVAGRKHPTIGVQPAEGPKP